MKTLKELPSPAAVSAALCALARESRYVDNPERAFSQALVTWLHRSGYNPTLAEERLAEMVAWAAMDWARESR